MGTIIASNCRICGHEIQFIFGGNMLNYRSNCPVPAINTITGNFENINYYEFKNNATYKFYYDSELKGDYPDNNATLRNFDLELNTHNNYCPNCRHYSFDFKVIGLID